MMTLKTLLAEKGGNVWTIDRSATVLEAAMAMNEQRIGALVVLEEGELCGIFTERDVLRRVVAAQRPPAATAVADVMTVEVILATQEMTLDEARTIMKHRRIRHLPVLDEQRRLLGLISIGDLNAHQAQSQERHIHFLNEYLHGRV